MTIHNIPDDLNVEELLDYLPENTARVVFRGHHARNAYGDILSVEETAEGRLQIEVARNSIYHDLPEYVFHRIDRFDNLPQLEAKERFEEELEKQERERENARRFFEPIDLLLLKLRVEVRRRLREWTDSNKVLLDILADRLTKEQKDNPLIAHAIQFLPACRNIRGNQDLLTLMMRKIFIEEGLVIEENRGNVSFTDRLPAHYHITEGSELGDCFAGNSYDDEAHAYTIHFWSDEKCNEHFPKFIHDVEEFRLFVQDYFLAVGDLLSFDIVTDAPPPFLNDNIVFNYLDYNTNL